MDFRPATAGDADAILQFWQDAGASMSVTDEPAYLARAMANPSSVLLLAEIDGHIVGSLLGTFDGWRGHMYRLAVCPRHRRQGIGRELVGRVERTLGGWGAKRILCLIECDRPWAAEFWTAVGYARNDHIVHVGVQ
jgi:ribosomal protein S18 acetylase RimI-like enzyme